MHTLFVFPFVALYEKETNLFDKIKNTDITFMFIHSHDDLFANIKDAQKLASLVKNKECWWIEKDSYHACHHLKKRELYQKKITTFIDKVVI